MRSCLSRQTGWLVLHGPEIMSAAGMPCTYGHSRSMLKTRVLTVCAVVAPISKALVRSSLTGGRNRVVPLVTRYIDILGSEVVRTSGYSNWSSSSPVCVSLDNYQAKMDGLPCLQISSRVSWVALGECCETFDFREVQNSRNRVRELLHNLFGAPPVYEVDHRYFCGSRDGGREHTDSRV